MDPITIILTAIVAGAAAASKDITAEAVKDAYFGLKNLITKKFSGKADVENAIEGIEKKPESESRQGVLKEELEDAKAGQAADVIQQAKALLKLLEDQGEDVYSYYRAELHGSGAIAQGLGATAVGAGGVSIGGSAEGSTIITGDDNQVKNRNQK